MRVLINEQLQLSSNHKPEKTSRTDKNSDEVFEKLLALFLLKVLISWYSDENIERHKNLRVRAFQFYLVEYSYEFPHN